MVEADPSCEMTGQWFVRPLTVTQVHDNGTVQLSEATDGGAVSDVERLQAEILPGQDVITLTPNLSAR